VKRPWLDLFASRLIPTRARASLYRSAGISVGPDTGINSDVFIDGNRLKIGARCYINRFCKFDAVSADVTIEDNVFIGFGVLVITGSHEHGSSAQRAARNNCAPVVIGRGSWIGANATILPGVTIGEGCVVAAGSVVTEDTKPDTLYAGVPALPKKKLA
jgi:acetyltransferase-like isoleucine patch superfamily enzyme